MATLRAPLKSSGSGDWSAPASPIVPSSSSQEGPFGGRSNSDADLTVHGVHGYIFPPLFFFDRGIVAVAFSHIYLSTGERVQLLLKRCVSFGDEVNRSCDVAFTDYRIIFMVKVGLEQSILNAEVERIRALPIDKNVPSNLRVPEGREYNWFVLIKGI